MDEADLRAKIRAIMQDASLSEVEKSEARQKLLMGKAPSATDASDAATQGT